MRLPTIFALSLALGAAGAYVALRPRADTPAGGVPVAAKPAPAVAPQPATPATTLAPTAPPARPKSGAPPPRARAPMREPTEAELAAAKAARVAARERMSKKQIRGLLHDALDGKLPDRELAPHDYDRLADAVLQLRAAQRVLRNVEETQASAALLVQHREAVMGALIEMEAVTGVPPSQLGELLGSNEPDDPDAGLSAATEEDPETIVHETLPQDSDEHAD